MPDAERLKREVAARALDFVQPGMRLGLGTGSTARHFVDLLGERVRQGLRLRCVPTSEKTEAQARACGIEVTTLEDMPELDLTVDGADEYDLDFNLIKGGGGALLREKIVAAASGAMIVIADRSKATDRLGRFPLPVEVNRFGIGSTTLLLGRVFAGLGLGGAIVRRIRSDGTDFVTDGGHLILDCHLGAIPDPQRLADRILAVPGVVEHGLFIGYARMVITNGPDGAAVIERQRV
jgi:ribose 5-phosphate isomerase A